MFWKRHKKNDKVKLLPHPNINLCYKCQCGKKHIFPASTVTFEGGVSIMCNHCKAVTFIPPDIFDRQTPHPFDPLGANICEDWSMHLKPPRPF